MNDVLERVRFQLEINHPVLAAMATKLESHPKNPSDDTGGLAFDIAVRLTFDGPALPEKRCGEILIPYPLADDWHLQVEPFLSQCEHDVAAAMKRAGLAWANPVVGRGGGGPSAGNASSVFPSEGGTCRPFVATDAGGTVPGGCGHSGSYASTHGKGGPG